MNYDFDTSQSNRVQISHLLLFTDMSRRGISEEIPLCVMCKWPFVLPKKLLIAKICKCY